MVDVQKMCVRFIKHTSSQKKKNTHCDISWDNENNKIVF